MLKLFRKKRGAVSVFLVIVLVPVILVTSVFIDASRMKLAQSVVSSSGDLAMNTVLSQYDQDLNDFYGMLASCQNVDEVIGTVKDYFVTSMVSQGISLSDADRTYHKIMGLFNANAQVSDFIQASVEDDSFSFTKTGNGSLTNPALIKTSIVDFMKFRSPINFAAEFFGKLKEVQEKSSYLEEEAKMIEEKQKYYKAENEMMEKALEIYKLILEYEALEIDKKYVEDLKSDVEGYEEKYRSIHHELLYNLFNTQGKGVFEKKYINTNPDVSYYGEDNIPSAYEVGDNIWDLQYYMYRYLFYKDELTGFMNDNAYDNSMYDIQFWVQMAERQEFINYYDLYIQAANEMCYYYEKLKNSYNYCEDDLNDYDLELSDYEGVDARGKKSLYSHYRTLRNQYLSLCSRYIDGDAYNPNKFIMNLNRISGNAIQNEITSPAAVTEQIEGMHERINGYDKKLKEGFDILGKIANETGKLKKLIANTHEQLGVWETAANNGKLDPSDLAKEDRNEVSSEKEKMEKFVTEENCDELIKRCNDVKSTLQNIRESLDDYAYNGKKIMNLGSYNSVKGASGIVKSRISIYKSELESYEKETFNFTNSERLPSINITDNNNPAIGAVNTPALYKWIKSTFFDYDDQKYDQGKKDQKKTDETADKQGDKVDDEGEIKSNEIKDKDNLPSKGNTGSVAQGSKQGKIGDAASFIGKLFSDFGGTMSEVGVSIRDDLYVTDYIMSMFSYDTYKNEGRYGLLGEEKQNNITPLNARAEYSKKDKEWSNPDKTFTANKTLRNHLVNEDYNYAYGSEVEYILYGGSNIKNKSASYGSIFLVRFGFNLAPVFQKYWKDNYVKIFAEGVQAATYGVVPAALVKLAICLGMTAAESAMDIAYLKVGVPVLLVKKKDDLYVQINTIFSWIGNTDQATKKSDGLKFQYSDYLSLFLFLSLLGKNADTIYLRTADVVQCNIQQVTKSDFLMSKSQMYFDLSVNIRVAPMMLSLPLASEMEGYPFDKSSWNKFQYKVTRGY